MNEEGQTSGGEMLGDAKARRTAKGNYPKRLRFRSPFRRVRPTEIGNIVGSFMVGMVIIFPLITLLSVGAPIPVLVVVAGIALTLGIRSKSFVPAGIVIGSYLLMTLLGFLSLLLMRQLFFN